jgi:hypothetical protein
MRYLSDLQAKAMVRIRAFVPYHTIAPVHHFHGVFAFDFTVVRQLVSIHVDPSSFDDWVRTFRDTRCTGS